MHPVPGPAPRTTRHYRPELQGLRGLAVALVVVYHVWLNRVSGGVDVFFLVSGFLLTGQLVRAAERGPLRLGRRPFPLRLRRLFPGPRDRLFPGRLAAAGPGGPRIGVAAGPTVGLGAAWPPVGLVAVSHTYQPSAGDAC